jgi:hypothetical protein
MIKPSVEIQVFLSFYCAPFPVLEQDQLWKRKTNQIITERKGIETNVLNAFLAHQSFHRISNLEKMFKSSFFLELFLLCIVW